MSSSALESPDRGQMHDLVCSTCIGGADPARLAPASAGGQAVPAVRAALVRDDDLQALLSDRGGVVLVPGGTEIVKKPMFGYRTGARKALPRRRSGSSASAPRRESGQPGRRRRCRHQPARRARPARRVRRLQHRRDSGITPGSGIARISMTSSTDSMSPFSRQRSGRVARQHQISRTGSSAAPARQRDFAGGMPRMRSGIAHRRHLRIGDVWRLVGEVHRHHRAGARCRPASRR